MDNLVAFLQARLDEDEDVASDATPGPWTSEWHGQHHTVSGPEPAGELIAEWIYAIASLEPEASVERAECDTRDAVHIARHDPARVLREVAAKRRIVDDYGSALDNRQSIRAEIRKILHSNPDAFGALSRQENALIDKAEGLLPIVRLIATVYADHPDYREEWRP